MLTLAGPLGRVKGQEWPLPSHRIAVYVDGVPLTVEGGGSGESPG